MKKRLHHRPVARRAAAGRFKPLNLLLALMIPVLLAGFSGVRAAAEPGAMLNLRDADITALIGTVAEATGRNFVIDPRVTGKVTVISASPTDPNDFYDLFLSILQVNGYTAVEAGGVTKVIPEANGKLQAPPTLGNQSANSEAQVTAVIKLKHISAVELIPVLRPLLPQHAHLSAHSSSNTLVAADSSLNINRLRQLVERIDQPMDRAIEVVRLAHATATELVPLLTAMIDNTGGGPGSSPLTHALSADSRTNSILLGGNDEFRLEMRSLISHLDTPLNFGNDTRVIYLHYAEADDLVPVLQSLANANNGGKKGGSVDIEIQADPRVNALILQGDPQRILSMQYIISQLDIRRAQVLVEGIIAEVSDDHSREIGVQWQSADTAEGLFGGTEFAGVNAGSLDDFVQSDLGTGLTLGFLRNGSMRSLLRLIRSDKGTNVLSTPSLVTLDNEEAEIVVGENVPFITGQFTGSANSADNPFQTIERRDVGVVLRVRPQINEGDAVRLEIEQEVSGVERDREGSDLITSKRSIKTTVIADDGQVIVLGGLISEDHQDTVNKVPLLGDLPVVGRLFRNRSESYVKTNLLVFLRPRIIRNSDSGSRLTANKYSYLRGLQLRHNQRQLGVLGEPVILPEVLFAGQAGDGNTGHDSSDHNLPDATPESGSTWDQSGWED